MLVKRFDFLFGKIFDIDQSIACAFDRGNYFVELNVNRLGASLFCAR